MNNIISVIILVLVLMILGHLIADYPLQGWLAQAKAKSYWANSKPENQHDYIPALIGHAVMWGIIVCLPLMFNFRDGGVAELGQILITWGLWVWLFGSK